MLRMKNVTDLNIVKAEHIGDIYHGCARVVITRVKGGGCAVVTYWPAGYDLIPSIVRGFATPEDAETEFQKAVARATTAMTPKA